MRPALRHVRALRANRALSISSRRPISCLPALLIALCLLPMLAAATETTLLSANFNDKPIGIFSGTGGADVGEPTLILGPIERQIIEVSPGDHALHLSRSFPGATQTSQVTFNLSGNAEPTTGQLRIRYRLRMSATNDIQRIQINEADGFGSKFGQLNPGTTGSISFYDSTSLNPIGAATSYTVDQWLQVEIVYNLDQHTDSLWIDGNPVFTVHDYAITDRGIGRVSFGFPNAGNGTVGGFDVDDIEVLYDANPGPDVVLDADFQDKTPGAPIATGGAALGEPVSIDAGLDTEIVDTGSGELALHVVGPSSNPTALGLRWRPLDGIEVESGTLYIDVAFTPEALDKFGIGVFEADGVTRNFGSLAFSSGGDIVAADAAGSIGVVGSYIAGSTISLHYQFDLDAQTVTVLDGASTLYSGRAYGVADRGIGQVVFGMLSGSSSGSPFRIDDLTVSGTAVQQIPAVIEFLQQPGWAFPNLPMSPSVEVAVVNVFDQIVPDGTTVDLELASGPAAAIGGASATTSLGQASFPSLSIDTAGTFTLRALSGRTAEATSFPFEISNTPPFPSVLYSKHSAPANGTTVQSGESLTYWLAVFVQNQPLDTDLVFADTLGPNLHFGGIDAIETSPGWQTDTSGNPLRFTLPAGTAVGSYTVTYLAMPDARAWGTVETSVAVDTYAASPSPTCSTCGTSHPLTTSYLDGFE